MVNPNYAANNSITVNPHSKKETDTITIPMSEYKSLVSAALLLEIIKGFCIKKGDTYGVISDVRIILGVEDKK